MKIKRITEITAVVLFIVFALLMVFSTRQDLFSTRYIEPYNAGWTYSFGDESGDAVLPAQYHLPKDTQLTLTNTLPEKIREGSAVAFRSRLQNVSVYVGDRLVYQFPEQELIGGELTSAWNFIPLSEADAGKQIRICLSSPYAGFSGRAENILFGDYNDLVTGIITQHIKIFRISILIGFVSLVIIAISVIGRRYQTYGWFRNLGFLLIIVAGWLGGEARLPSGIVGLEMWHYLALVSLMYCPVFLTAYLYARWPDLYGKVTSVLFYVSLAGAAGCSVIKLAGGADLIEMIPVTYVTLGVTLIYAVWIHIQAARRKRSEFIRSELICILVIFLAGMAEALRFGQRGNVVGVFVRLAVLLYALNLLRISVTVLYRRIRENQELQQHLKRSRAELMASQIRPHFIYNTLNSIRALIKVDPEKARQTVYDFSTYLRLNLESVEREMIPFSDELRHVQAYLNIEKVRFEERLNVVMDIREKSFFVPPLTIQPLVENAVKHGICAKADGGTVTIRTRKEKDGYVVEVEDDGRGFDTTAPVQERKDGQTADASSHIGLENIRFRVEEISGGSLSIESRPGSGTKVTVRFRNTKELKKPYAGDDRR